MTLRTAALQRRISRQQHPLIGYLFMTSATDESYVALGDVSNDWDIITVMSFGFTPDNGTWDLHLCFKPACANHETERDFKRSLQSKIQMGVQVELHVGASGEHPLYLDSDAFVDNMVQDVTRIVNSFGFTGVQFDLWAVRCDATGGDTDFKTPVDETTIRVINLMRSLRTSLGTDVALTLAAYIFTDAEGHIQTTPSCLAALHALRETVSTFILRPQGTNSADFIDANGDLQVTLSAEYPVAAADLVLRSSGTQTDAGIAFPPFSAEKVMIVAAKGALESSGASDPATIKAALSCILSGDYCGKYTMSGDKNYPGFRGIEAMSINVDAKMGGVFRTSMRKFLNTLAPSELASSLSVSTSETLALRSTATPTTTSRTAITPTTWSNSSNSDLLSGLTPASSSTSQQAYTQTPSDSGNVQQLQSKYIIIAVVASTTLVLGLVAWIVPRFIRRERRRRAIVPLISEYRPAEIDQSQRQVATVRRDKRPISTERPIHAVDEDQSGEVAGQDRMIELQAAVQRAGFSVNALLDSLNRIGNDVRASNLANATLTDLPTYDEGDSDLVVVSPLSG